ncbi:MAG TPA: hypothetical protein VM695_07395 [Phycisphaerae bacterium]|nr:hypothetical protein [Phycisphaerae bacterium]
MVGRMTQVLRVGGKAVRLAAVLSLVGVGGVALYSHSKGRIVADIYRQRLRELSDQYKELRGLYSEVVKKTAVTELVLAGGRLSVVIRTAEGVLRAIPTDLDPSKEVHVEYIARDGRLWIRRVYTMTDPDERGRADANVVAINPALNDLPWSEDADLQGLSVFRKQLSEGRWVVTTTGNAALALTKLEPGQASDLASPPSVRDYPELEREIQDEVERLTFVQVVDRLINEP